MGLKESLQKLTKAKTMKRIWEADVDDVKKFLVDQKKNSMAVKSSSVHVTWDCCRKNRG